MTEREILGGLYCLSELPNELHRSNWQNVPELPAIICHELKMGSIIPVLI